MLLENLLRTEGNGSVTAEDIEALATWDANAEPSKEIAFTPARVVMQDFTGVPAVVDLAAMRDAMADLGGDPAKINPLVPAELVIDHSVQVDVFGTRDAFARNAEREFERNQERYAFLRWGQDAFDNFAVVPPDTGIVHQVNLEYLARVVFVDDEAGVAYPDTLVGTDSHTTMINGLGVLGWGVGGIEAEAAMLGQPMSMLIPQVIGFKLPGELPEGATATDLVLTVTELLRNKGVVGKFVEFYGPGVSRAAARRPGDDRQHEPRVRLDVRDLPDRRRDAALPRVLGPPEGAHRPRRGLRQGAGPLARREQRGADVLRHGRARPRRGRAVAGRPEAPAGPRGARHGEGRASAPRSRTSSARTRSRRSRTCHDEAVAETFPASDPPANGAPGPRGLAGARDAEPARRRRGGARRRALAPRRSRSRSTATTFKLDHGHVVIAAITSCTNTSNPSVMLGAGLLARNARARGLQRQPWVKTSLAPGSKVVTEYLERAGPRPSRSTSSASTSSATAARRASATPARCRTRSRRRSNEGDLAVVSVLSGNRNFEGRINPDVKMNYLASPPLVVAYALAGTMDIDLVDDPLGIDADGNEVYLRDLWPSEQEVAETVEERRAVGHVPHELRRGLRGRRALERRSRSRPATASRGPDESTYVRQPPYFEGMPPEPEPLSDFEGARVLAKLGDSVTTDHISPAGSIKKDGPAGAYLIEHGVEPRDFNSYGSRRGNHEVMMRGTFANIRLRNQLAPGTEGGVTRYLGDGSGEEMSIYDAAMAYAEEGTPLVVLGGKEYGSGSSRDWAAKGTNLLGVRAVIAESFERIHRSNLVGMGVLPLQYPEGESAESLGLTGEEEFSITGLAEPLNAGDAAADGEREGGRRRVRGARADRHAQGGRVLPPRRDPAVRAALARGVVASSGPQAAARPSNSRAAAQDRACPTRHLSVWIGTSGSGPHAGAT